jgi:hypothetical protein
VRWALYWTIANRACARNGDTFRRVAIRKHILYVTQKLFCSIQPRAIFLDL